MAEIQNPTMNYAELIQKDRIHGRLYYDPIIFADELEKIWRRGWVYVGHESEIPQPGDFVTRQIGLQPVIMVRDHDGNLNLMLNRCRHRANVVCQAERGKASFFRCDYHGWTYSDKGELLRVTYGEAYGGSFDKASYGLLKVTRMDSYRGFIFASLSGEGISLDEHLGPAKQYIDSFVDRSPVGEIDLGAGTQKGRYRGNWKMIIENSLEGNYHGHFLHQYFFDLASARTGVDRAESSHAQAYGHIRYLPGGHMLEDLRWGRYQPGSPVVDRKLPGGVWEEYVNAVENRLGQERSREVLAGSQFLLVFPNLILLPTHVRRIQPAGPEETHVYYYPALFKGASREVNVARLREHEEGYGPAGFLAADDLDICERNQIGLKAREDEWLLLARGLHREEAHPDGVLIGYGTDESHLRGLWRHYKSLMTGS